MGNYRALFALLVFLVCPEEGVPRAWSASTLEKQQERQIFQDALSRFQRRDIQGSLELFRRLTAASPGSAHYWFNLGNCQLVLGQYLDGAKSYEQVSLLGSPLSLAAAVFQAKALRLHGSLFEAEEVLLSLRSRELPQNLQREWEEEQAELAEELLVQALSHYEENRNHEALHLVNRSISLKSLAQAHQLKGLLYLRLKRHSFARQELRRAHEEGISGLDVLIDMWTDDRQKGTAQLVLETFTGIDSNPYGESEAFESAALGGVRLAYWSRLHEWREVFFHWSAQAAMNEHIAAPENRRFGTWVQARAAYEIDDWTIGADPHVNLGLGPVSTGRFFAAGARLGAQKNLPAGASFGASWLLQSQKFHDPDVNFLSATNQFRELYWKSRGRDLGFRVSLVHQVDGGSDQLFADGGVLPLAGSALGPALELSRESGRWETGLQAAYFRRHFSKLAQPGLERRVDQEFSLALRGGWEVSDAWRANAVVDFRKNSSTLGQESVSDRNYVRWAVLGGMSWRLPL